MEIQFFDSNRAPQPRDKVRIEDLKAAPYPDRFRVFIEIQVTPFQERPNLIVVVRQGDRIVGELSVIETMHAKMEFTLHIRNIKDPAGIYDLTADLFYENKNPPQDRRTIQFTIPGENDPIT
jgi:hypothetical protein